MIKDIKSIKKNGTQYFPDLKREIKLKLKGLEKNRKNNKAEEEKLV